VVEREASTIAKGAPGVEPSAQGGHDQDQRRAHARRLREHPARRALAEEFVLDFVLSLPPQPTCSARVIVSPGHVKRIIGALQQNLARYEQAHGPVRETPAGLDGRRIGFAN